MRTSRYKHTDFTDEIIRKAYASKDYRKNGGGGSITAAARKLGWHKNAIYRRAVELGIAVPHWDQKSWTDPEIFLIGKHAHKNLGTISRILKQSGYARSQSAIKHAIQRHFSGVNGAKLDHGFYSSTQAAICLGVHQTTIGNWIGRGWIKAEMQGTLRTESQKGDHYLIQESELRRVLIEHTQEIHFGKIDKFWLVDILTGRGSDEQNRKVS